MYQTRWSKTTWCPLQSCAGARNLLGHVLLPDRYSLNFNEGNKLWSINLPGEKKKRAVLSDSESDGGVKDTPKRKKAGSDSGSETSDKPKKKSKKIVDSDDDEEAKKDGDGGKFIRLFYFKLFVEHDVQVSIPRLHRVEHFSNSRLDFCPVDV